MIEKEIDSLNQFHDLTRSFTMTHPIYRGVTSPSHELISRFGRSLIANEKLRQDSDFSYVVDLSTEEVVLRNFIKQCRSHLKGAPENEWEWLAVAQHHGLPTKLLDWTENPLVAAYFACVNYRESTRTDAAIYVLENRSALDEVTVSESPFAITETAIFRPSHITPRITAQSGLFTVHNIPNLPFEHEMMQKWIIKEECIIDMVIMINRYGVDHASMFPGADGISKLLTEQFGLI